MLTNNCANFKLPVFQFTVIKIGNHILHMGGTAVPFGITSTSRLYDLDLNSLEWKTCKTAGDTPTEKYGHVSSLRMCCQSWVKYI